MAHTRPGVVDDPGGDNLFENVFTLNDRLRILEHAVFGRGTRLTFVHALAYGGYKGDRKTILILFSKVFFLLS